MFNFLKDSDGGGVVSPKVYKDPDIFMGYDLILYPQMESIPLARLEGFKDEIVFDKKWFHFQRFLFNQDAFKKAVSYIQSLNTKKYSPIIIDEIGPIELQAGGFAPIIWNINSKELFLTVRKSLIEQVIRVFHINKDNCKIVSLD